MKMELLDGLIGNIAELEVFSAECLKCLRRYRSWSVDEESFVPVRRMKSNIIFKSHYEALYKNRKGLDSGFKVAGSLEALKCAVC